MRIELLALYGGPDQVMTVTSGLASVLGLPAAFLEQGCGDLFKVVRKSAARLRLPLLMLPRKRPKGTP